MKLTTIGMLFALVMLVASNATAGCGLLRRGGCSDPCTAGACAGVAFHRGSCGGCARMSGVVSGGYVGGYSSVQSTGYGYQHGQVTCNNYMPSSYVQSGYVQSTIANFSVPATGTAPQAVYSQPAISAATIQRADLVDCGPVASYQVVMQSEYSTQTQQVPYTEYRDEIRYRTRIVSRQVPVEVQDYRTKVVMVPTTETKTVEYSVLVPHTEEKAVEYTESVPVWNEVQENYTVKVPTVVEVPEQYTVRVPKLRDESFTYTIQVPQTQTEQRVQRVVNAVPVTKTRTVDVVRPVSRTQSVTRDQGHWEMRVEEVAASAAPVSVVNAPVAIGGCGTGTTYVSGGQCGNQSVYGYSSGCGCQAVSSSCGGCGRSASVCQRGCGRAASSCGSCGQSGGCAGQGHIVSGGCGQASDCGGYSGIGGVAVHSVASSAGCGQTTQTVTRRVWVPNIVSEEVSVIENITEQQEITYTAFEQQSIDVPYECVKVVYVPEQRTGTRKVVDYDTETRTRTRKVVQYNDETRTRTRKELTYKQETRTQTVPHVSYTTEKRTKEVSFTVNVPQTEVEPVTSTRYETVNEEVSEEYTVRVPVTSYREQQIQVCRMVPKLVPVTINPCQANPSHGSISYGTSVDHGVAPSAVSGCGSCGNSGVPTLAPASCGCVR